MTTTITTELQELIKKHLPSHMSETLASELSALAQLRADNPRLLARAEKAEAENKDMAARAADVAARTTKVAEREAAVSKREAEVTLREKVIELREKHADEKVTLMRGVVGDVFANSRLKYTETVPLVVPQGGSTGGGGYTNPSQIQTATRHVVAEGQP